MSERIKHMGMRMTEEEHEKWHREHQDMTPEEHEDFTKRMRISEEEHDNWHKKYGVSLSGSAKMGGRLANPYAVGGGFLNYCVRQG